MTTTAIDHAVVHGMVAGILPDMLILNLPDTSYRLYLRVDSQITLHLPPVNSAICGKVHAHAERIDVVRAGGRYIEPLYGRPRHVQGMVLAIDAQANTLLIHCGCPMICTPTQGQKAADFAQGQLVAFDLVSGATFEPAYFRPAGVSTAAPSGVSDSHSDLVPFGHAPSEGHQGALEETIPGPAQSAIHDAGALNDKREITGMDAPPADFPIDG